MQEEKGVVLSNAVARLLAGPRDSGVGMRTAEMKDVKFIDDLQRKHARMVGWFPTKQLEAYVARGQVLIAEEAGGMIPADCQPLGYCIARDRYFKRDDCGIIYQLNVAPGKQRGLMDASAKGRP